MSLLRPITSALSPDPFARALERLTQARADLATAEAQAADGTARSKARLIETKKYPHLLKAQPSDWSPSRYYAGEIAIGDARDALNAAEVEYDSHEPRVQKLRNRLRQTREQLASADKTTRISEIAAHVEALRGLGVEVGDLASTAAQKDLGDEFGRIADELNALRADRRRDNMPRAHLFSVDRVEHCRPLRNLGIYEATAMLDGLRQAAYANALTAETLASVCDLLGAAPAPESWRLSGRGYEIKTESARWDKTQAEKAKHLDDQRLGLRY